jgi:hypothetical protein
MIDRLTWFSFLLHMKSYLFDSPILLIVTMRAIILFILFLVSLVHCYAEPPNEESTMEIDEPFENHFVDTIDPTGFEDPMETKGNNDNDRNLRTCPSICRLTWIVPGRCRKGYEKTRERWGSFLTVDNRCMSGCCSYDRVGSGCCVYVG